MSSAASGVRVWEERLTIPTYERGPEDKNPSLPSGRRNPIHPASAII